MAQTHKGMNRNLLVLGVITLLALGGIAAFLAARSGGNIFNTVNNITNQIIHNSYFTQLIASGVTTEKDLKAIAEIRPYGDSFIGISKEPLTWEQAEDFAKRTGAEVLPIEDTPEGSRKQLADWLNATFPTHLGSTLWVRQDGQTQVLDRRDVLSVTSLDSPRKVILQWKPDSGRTIAAPVLASQEDKDQAVAIITKLGGTYEVDPGLPGQPIIAVGNSDWTIDDAGLNQLKNLRGLSRIKKFNFGKFSPVTNSGLAAIAEMKSLEWIRFWGCSNLTDEGWKHLSALTNLNWLNIGYTGFSGSPKTTGSGLKYLRGLKNLRTLILGAIGSMEGRHLENLVGMDDLERLDLAHSVMIDDAALDHIKQLKGLKELALQDTRVSDVGLLKLKEMRHLESVRVRDTKVTDAGVAELQKAMSGLNIRRD